jgi:predicted nucleic acid-binding protein
MSSRPQVLLDSNIVIYAIAPAPSGLVAAYLAAVDPVASVVTRIEVLGFTRLGPVDRAMLEGYFATVTMVAVDDEVVDRAISLRQVRKMSLGDSVIAATAMEYGLPLATRNVRDFSWIEGLQVIDPLTSSAS